MNNSDIKITFFGVSFGEIVRDKLKEAGFVLVDATDHPDLAVVGFYGKILSKEELSAAKYGTINVHPSLLPKYRGPTPVPTTILNGDEETGVTIIHLDEEVDHGPILAQQTFQISNAEFEQGVGKPTTPELRRVLWELGGDMIVDVVLQWIDGKITAQEQKHDEAVYTEKLTREDGEIDWTKSVEYIERQIRAFTPWPGAFTFWKGKRIKILKAHIENSALVIDELQMEGKKPTTMQAFLLGHKDFYVGPQRT